MCARAALDSDRTRPERLFGELLVSKGYLSHRELIEALNHQRHEGGRLGEVLSRLKMIADEQIAGALAEHLTMESVRLDDVHKIDMNIARSIPEGIAKRFGVVAIGEIDNQVILAMSDPLDIVARDTIALRLNRQVKVVVGSPREISHAIDTVYHGSEVDQQRLRDLVELEIRTEGNGQEAGPREGAEADISGEEAARKAPVIRFVDLLLSQAVKSRASDIHVEPREKSMTIRMRIDGVLRDMVPPARTMQAAVSTRLKILSKMDIAERRLPQDGRFRIKAPGRDIDVRVSVIPTIYGEKVVMRILDSAAVNHNLDELGFEPQLLDEFKSILAQPYGIIVVTGPTGSGKSTTLYSALNYLKNPGKNITTVEDPVEYRLDGINQIQVKPEIDLDFAVSLRAILRQDPDIILVGEIRDTETVEIAIKASMTGHLVLSTFHTNDAPSAISRFVYMGVEPYLLASSLNLVIAQRLVRRICERCKAPVKLNDEVLNRLKIDAARAKDIVFYRGKGCKACGDTGYFGRLPIFEFLVMDSELRDRLTSRAAESELRALARQRGYGGLLDSGVGKILQGLTTAEEVLSATFMENIKAAQ
ncbi:MAG TPA: ATPase, T2SS/T4P/T4SS family [Sedimentisphaerales bacterium]|nr:ATPase, T2SS/T4P/T4SS family [Sedimentisphaerales bacterium]